MNALMRIIRAERGPTGWAYSIERNPGRLGTHAHCWVNGPLLDDAALADYGRRVGAGLLHQVPATTTLIPLGYGLKDLTRSLTLPLREGLAAQADYLDRNGGRVVHASRAFWVDGLGRPTRLRLARTLGGRLAADHARRAAA
jgi:hypothetical protein